MGGMVWREEVFSMASLIQLDIERGTEYYYMLKQDNATHHNVIEIDGQLCWEADPLIDMMFKKGAIDLDKVMAGADKNDPMIRDFYRQAGYSLYEYRETFHWEVNNPKAKEYNPGGDSLL